MRFRLALVAAVLAAPAFAADDPGAAIVARVRAAKLDDKPFTLVVRVTVKAGQEATFTTAAAAATGPSRKEPGCVAYEFSRDVDAPTTFVIYERWKNLAALEAHLKTPHFAAVAKVLGETAAGPPEIKLATPIFPPQ